MDKTNTTPGNDKDSNPEPGPDPFAGEAEKIPPELNGPKGPEPTRFGDWERKGRCVDF